MEDAMHLSQNRPRDELHVVTVIRGGRTDVTEETGASLQLVVADVPNITFTFEHAAL